jgi:hypothetical protein
MVEPVSSGALVLVELRESFGIEQRRARVYAGTTNLLADGAMTLMRGVPVALLGATRARADAGLQQPAHEDAIRAGGAR